MQNNNKQCPCGSQLSYIECCEPLISAKKIAQSPEALMRSRYVAYTFGNIDYIERTMCGEASRHFQHDLAVRWARRVKWIKLEVFGSITRHDNCGFVEFKATFIEGCQLKNIHEKSEFLRVEGRWYYVQGIHLAENQKEVIMTRNMLCPCGSLSKFKNCHGK